MGDVLVDGALTPGLVVASNYRVVKPLAAGGFGTVYLGENTTLDQRVVIKVLRGGERGAAAEEARMLASLDHPNVVHVYAYDEANDCLVMQYLSGESLVDQAHRIDLLASVRVVYQVALALKAVHGAGLVHRDVKPENVMLGRERDWVKLIDMGTALRVGRTVNPPAGTPEFCPPEQFDGAIPASPANDVYSLGVTLFNLCTRQLPFDGSPEELGRAHCFTAPPDLAEVYRSLNGPQEPRVDFVVEKVAELVDEMLAKDPAKRPDARAVASRLGDLESSFSGGATEARFVLPLTQEVAAAKRTSTMVLPKPGAGPSTREALGAVEKSNARMFVVLGLAIVILFFVANLLMQRVFPGDAPDEPQVEAVVDAGFPRVEAVAVQPTKPPEPESLEPLAVIAPTPVKPPPAPVLIKKPNLEVQAAPACLFDERFRDYARRTRGQLRDMPGGQSSGFASADDRLADALVDKDCRRANDALNSMRRLVGAPLE